MPGKMLLCSFVFCLSGIATWLPEPARAAEKSSAAESPEAGTPDPAHFKAAPSGFGCADIVEDGITVSRKRVADGPAIPSARKRLLSTSMTVSQVVALLGPGCTLEQSGTGVTHWNFDDGSSLQYAIWTPVDSVPDWTWNP